MNKILSVIAAFIFSASFLLHPVFAQEAAAPETETEDIGEETEFSFGTVKSVTENEVVVSEYDYETNADVDVTYKVPAETEFENATTLKDIKAGDSIDIDFLVKDGVKTAIAITVETPLQETEETPLETVSEKAAE